MGSVRLSDALATATGSTTARSLAARFADVVNVKDYGAVVDGVTDDTAAIQRALDRARDLSGRRVLIPASTRISAPLIIYSNTWLDVDPSATVTFTASVGNMLQNRSAATAVRTVTDAAMTVSTTALTSATAAFTSADVGRAVVVAGAGGGGSPLAANISVVTNSTTVTLSTTAKTDISGATCAIYDRDSNIKISGGTWARGSAGGADPRDRHTLMFRRVDRLTILDARFTSSGGKFSVSAGDVTVVNVQRVNFATASDGVHITGPAASVVVRDVTGTTGDDAVAFTGRDYTGYDDVTGDISDVVVQGVYTTSTTGNVKFITGTGTIARNVVMRDIGGTAPSAIKVTDDTTGPTDIGGLVIDGVTTLCATNSEVKLDNTAGRDVVVRNVVQRATTTVAKAAIQLGNWESVIIDGVTANTSSTSMDLVRVVTSRTVGDLSLSNVSVVSGGTGSNDVLNVYGTLTRYRLTNIAITSGKGVLGFYAGSTVGPGSVSSVTITGTNRFANVYVATDVTLSNITIDSPVNAVFYVSTGPLTIRGAGINRVTAWAGLQRAGSEVVRVVNPDFPVDLSALAKNDGDTAYNTNAGLACGAGRAISDGTNWKNLFSGATY